MFVQVIRGPVRDEQAAREVLESWMDELRPGAIGWLGSTAGVTPAGDLVVLARFASEEEARQNSDRPEQGDWWARAEQQFAGPVTFHDCPDVAMVLDGGSDDAGFVQVMEFQAPDPPSAAEIAEPSSRFVRAHRPDVLGGVVAVSPEGYVCQAVYFTSEEEAREHEAATPPEEDMAEWEEFVRRLGEPTYHDLRSPLLLS